MKVQPMYGVYTLQHVCIPLRSKQTRMHDGRTVMVLVFCPHHVYSRSCLARQRRPRHLTWSASDKLTKKIKYWRKYSGGSRISPKRDGNLSIGQISPKTAWKWRKLGRGGLTSKFLLCRSATQKRVEWESLWNKERNILKVERFLEVWRIFLDLKSAPVVGSGFPFRGIPKQWLIQDFSK